MSPRERIAALAEGRDPKAVLRLESGWVTLAENQFLRGYCLLLADPMVGQLTDLSVTDQAKFLADMAAVGRAVQAVTGAVRMNFAIYGNLDPFLHAHIWPRFADESEVLRTLPPLTFPSEVRTAEATAFHVDQHESLRQQLEEELRRVVSAG